MIIPSLVFPFQNSNDEMGEEAVGHDELSSCEEAHRGVQITDIVTRLSSGNFGDRNPTLFVHVVGIWISMWMWNLP